MTDTAKPIQFPSFPLPRIPIPFPKPKSELFKPTGSIVSQGNGIYDIHAEVVVPNRCFNAEEVEIALPPGSSYSPTTIAHALLHISYDGGIDRLCSMQLNTLTFFGDDLNFGEGINTLYLHTILENRVILGTTSFKLPTESDVVSNFGIFPWPGVSDLAGIFPWPGVDS